MHRSLPRLQHVAAERSFRVVADGVEVLGRDVDRGEFDQKRVAVEPVIQLRPVDIAAGPREVDRRLVARPHPRDLRRRHRIRPVLHRMGMNDLPQKLLLRGRHVGERQSGALPEIVLLTGDGTDVGDRAFADERDPRLRRREIGEEEPGRLFLGADRGGAGERADVDVVRVARERRRRDRQNLVAAEREGEFEMVALEAEPQSAPAAGSSYTESE